MFSSLVDSAGELSEVAHEGDPHGVGVTERRAELDDVSTLQPQPPGVRQGVSWGEIEPTVGERPR
jgi:hypothetical protein